MPEQRRDPAPERSARPQQDQQKKSEHGGRQHQRQGGQRLQRRQPAAASQHQQRRQRHGHGQQNRRGHGGQPESEGERLPVHHVLVNRGEAALGKLACTGGGEQVVEQLVRGRRAELVLLTITAPCSIGGYRSRGITK